MLYYCCLYCVESVEWYIVCNPAEHLIVSQSQFSLSPEKVLEIEVNVKEDNLVN